MGANNHHMLNRLFTRNTLSDFLKLKKSDIYTKSAKTYINNTHLPNRTLLREIYQYMFKHHRNEYIYKNTLLNKLLLGRHSLNTTTALTEVPVGKSKADFILINGSAIVYEIKTELDTLDRLNGQLENYYKVFDKVCVITSPSNYEKVRAMLDNSNVGICILTNRNTISTKREPVSDTSKLDLEAMFKILRKEEFENIIKSYYGDLPQVKQVEHFKVCLNFFKNIDLDSAYKYMLAELKKRKKIQDNYFKDRVPYEIKFLVYFSDFKERDYEKLEQFLDKNFGG
ncbi:sce7726 family protein [Natranaerobius trueperi]|uniref:Sce7726 family protein n=1 Tax=Natranaerobius trueperi TaxID=759412 RepID=A0A226BX96_9FIRM|nr:sce7726 family protein [Natranaerobius trueperi]OWZ82727.1 hypothetical protein CDO51_12515 [Natranaerobius trueperi]